MEGRGGGRRARLMAGGAVAGSGLAAAGPEGRRPGVGARAAAGGLRFAVCGWGGRLPAGRVGLGRGVRV